MKFIFPFVHVCRNLSDWSSQESGVPWGIFFVFFFPTQLMFCAGPMAWPFFVKKSKKQEVTCCKSAIRECKLTKCTFLWSESWHSSVFHFQVSTKVTMLQIEIHPFVALTRMLIFCTKCKSNHWQWSSTVNWEKLDCLVKSKHSHAAWLPLSLSDFTEALKILTFNWLSFNCKTMTLTVWWQWQAKHHCKARC